jgi:hypothetical protein
LEEKNLRDCDIIVATNMVTFLILWKIQRYAECTKYLEKSRKAVMVLLEEEQKRKSKKTLSIIEESNGGTDLSQRESVESFAIRE